MMLPPNPGEPTHESGNQGVASLVMPLDSIYLDSIRITLLLWGSSALAVACTK